MPRYRSACGNCVYCGKNVMFLNNLVSNLPTTKYQDSDEAQGYNCVSHDMMLV